MAYWLKIYNVNLLNNQNGETFKILYISFRKLTFSVNKYFIINCSFGIKNVNFKNIDKVMNLK